MKVCLQDTPVILIQKGDNSKHGRKKMYVLNVSQRGLATPLAYTKKCFNKGLTTHSTHALI